MRSYVYVYRYTHMNKNLRTVWREVDTCAQRAVKHTNSMWRLETLNGELVALLPVNGQEQYTVGRRENDILLADKSVSRAHAVLRLDGGELWVMDLGSKFGSQLGAARLV